MSIPEFWLTDWLNSQVTAPRFFRPDSGFFHPTEASVQYTNSYNEVRTIGGCSRKTWYRLMDGQIPAERVDDKPNLYLNWSARQGKVYEAMHVEMYKEGGIWKANNIPFLDRTWNIKGELDTIILPPGIDLPILTEEKTFYGFMAKKHLLGSFKPFKKGAPKDNHLLQTALYLYFFKGHISHAILHYMARDSDDHTEFHVALHEQDGKHCIYIRNLHDTSWRKESRFVVEDILDRFALVRVHLENHTLPPADFQLIWDAERVEREFARGEVGKTKYQDWKKKPGLKKNRIGDFLCSTCPFRELCKDNIG